MAGDWKEVPLDQIYDFRSGLSKPRSAFGAGHAFLSFKDVFYNYFVPDKLTELVNSTEDERSLCSIERGDVFLTRTSETLDELGMSCVALRHYEGATFNGFTKRLRPRSSSNIVPEYAGYFFRSQQFRSKVTAMSSLSTRASLNNEMLARLTITIPPIEDQTAIGRILKAFDDKIELNRKMNQTLEAMARAIFKSWFVDFEPVRAKAEGRPSTGSGQAIPGLPADIAGLFPDSFEDSELGEIPKGWCINNIEDVAERVAMGPFGSSIRVNTFVTEGIPVISGQHLRNTMLHDHDYNFITFEHAEELKKANVARGDVIFTHAGSIGQVAYIPESSQYERYVISQRQFYMRCDSAKVSSRFITLYFQSPEGQHKLLANTSSTGVPSISRPVTYLRSIRLCIPPKPIIDEFERLVQPMHINIRANIGEADKLAALRDALLPKLVSGEIRVKC